MASDEFLDRMGTNFLRSTGGGCEDWRHHGYRAVFEVLPERSVKRMRVRASRVIATAAIVTTSFNFLSISV